MKWNVHLAKNGGYTLSLNDIQLYSKYNPLKSAQQYVQSIYNESAESYFLIGIGLGYHLKVLLELEEFKPITVIVLSEDEWSIFKKFNDKNSWWERKNVNIISDLEMMSKVSYTNKTQIILPSEYVKALKDHPLFDVLEYIKKTQISYNQLQDLLEINFHRNLQLNHSTIKTNNALNKKIACLVSAGPSLNETVSWLKNITTNIGIYSVGSALKVLLENEIIPDGVVISDANDIISQQFTNVTYTGPLYYLSTANNLTVKNFNGEKIILFQKGYPKAEEYALERQYPLLETGGSVATVTFSLIEKLGYQTVILFGQDLGFIGNETHASTSSSNKVLTNFDFVRDEIANDGTNIKTKSEYTVFKFWFNKKVSETTMNVYNTAKKGAKITGAPLIDFYQFKKLLNGEL